MLNMYLMPANSRKKNPAVDAYIEALVPERRESVVALRNTLFENLPEGFEEHFSSMPGYVVPLEIYPAGYHVTADTPLPFISFASQKGFLALYHFGMYVDSELHDWFVEQYPKHMNTKLDMGKSCIRFRKPEQIPLALIAELMTKRSVDEWVLSYENARQR